MSLTTWDYMVKYNLPISGGVIRILSPLDSYVKIGGIYRVGWGKERFDSYLTNQETDSGVGVSLNQFEGCRWEYLEDEPVYPRPVWVLQDGGDFYIYQSRKQADDPSDDAVALGPWKTHTVFAVKDSDLQGAEKARQEFIDTYCRENQFWPQWLDS